MSRLITELQDTVSWKVAGRIDSRILYVIWDQMLNQVKEDVVPKIRILGQRKLH
jgi:hypothetical protein